MKRQYIRRGKLYKPIKRASGGEMLVRNILFIITYMVTLMNTYVSN